MQESPNFSNSDNFDQFRSHLNPFPYSYSLESDWSFESSSDWLVSDSSSSELRAERFFPLLSVVELVIFPAFLIFLGSAFLIFLAGASSFDLTLVLLKNRFRIMN